MKNTIIDYPTVSVILPVYNGEKTIKRCLQSLMELQYPKDKLERIVVDNASTDKTKNIVQEFPVKYVFEERKGLSYARNTGIKISKGEWVAFIDSDCIADCYWLSLLMKVSSNKEVMGAGGKINSTTPKAFAQRYAESRNILDQKSAIEGKHFPFTYIIGANMAYRKKIFNEIGFFDPIFSSFGGGEEAELGLRVYKKRFKLHYCNEAIVYHDFKPGVFSICKQMFYYACGHFYLYQKHKDDTKLSLTRRFNARKKNILKSIMAFLFDYPNFEEKKFQAIDICLIICKSLGYVFGVYIGARTGNKQSHSKPPV